MSGFPVGRSRIAAKAEAGHEVLSGKLSEELNGTYARGPGIALYSHEVWLSNSACRTSSIAAWGCGTPPIVVTAIDGGAFEQLPSVARRIAVVRSCEVCCSRRWRSSYLITGFRYRV